MEIRREYFERAKPVLGSSNCYIRGSNSLHDKLFFSSGPSKSSATTSEAPEEPMFQYDSSKEIQVQSDSRATAL